MSEASPQPAASSPKGLRLPRSILLSAVLSVFGAALWIYAAATAGTPAAMPAGVNAFAAGDTTAETTRLIDDAAPALTRLGVSFIAGFAIAWLFRKFVVGAIMTAAVLGGLFYLAQRLGIAQIDWDAARQHVSDSLDWAKGQADAAHTFIMGYLPSGASGMVGMFFGARKR